MSNITKHFKTKARGLGMIRGAKSAGDNIPVKVQADEAILPKKTVRALGGARGVAGLIKQTTGKMPTGIRAGSHHALGGVNTDALTVQARQDAALADTQKINTRANNAAANFQAELGMPEVEARQGIAARQTQATNAAATQAAADFRATPKPAIDQFGIPANRTVPASPTAAAIDFKPAPIPAAAPATAQAGLSLAPMDSIPYQKPAAPAAAIEPPASMTSAPTDAPRTIRNLPTASRVKMFEAPVAPQPMPGRVAPAAQVVAQPIVQQTPVAPAAAQPAPKIAPIAPEMTAPAPAAAAPVAEEPGFFRSKLNQAASRMGFTPTAGAPAAPTAPAAPPKPAAVSTGENLGAATAGQFKPGSGMMRLGAADLALRSGGHWDATAGGDDSDRGGIGFMDKGQIVLRDMLGTAASTGGGIVGGGVGAVAGSPAGKLGRVGGALTGGFIGANKANELADGVMGGIRRGLNSANGAMGGDPEYWKDSDTLVANQNKFLQAQPGYSESTIQRGAKATTGMIQKGLEAVGLTSPVGANPAASKPVAAAPVTPAAIAPVAPAVAQPAAAAPVAPARNDGALALPDAELRRGLNSGSVGLNNFQNGTGAVTNSSGKVIRIDSRPSPEQQASAAKAAAGPDMTTSQGILAQAQQLSKSSNTDDRVMGAKLMRHAFPQMLQAETSKYASDSTRAASRASLTREMYNKRSENVIKQMDNEFGAPTGKDNAPNAPRQKFESDLRNTLGEAGFDLGDLTPKDMMEFKVAHAQAQEIEPSAARQLYMNWIQSRPFVKDHNPHRQLSRAKGEEGETGPLGLYQNANGWDVNQAAAVGKNYLTGSYDKNAKQYIGK